MSPKDVTFVPDKADTAESCLHPVGNAVLPYGTGAGDERSLRKRSLQMILRFQRQHFFFPELIDGA